MRIARCNDKAHVFEGNHHRHICTQSVVRSARSCSSFGTLPDLIQTQRDKCSLPKNKTHVAYKFSSRHSFSAGWKSGDQNWIVDLCTPFGGASDIIGELCKTVFKGQTLNQVSAGPDGKLVVITWPPAPDEPSA
jgi:RTX toxin acyltransferase family